MREGGKEGRREGGRRGEKEKGREEGGEGLVDHRDGTVTVVTRSQGRYQQYRRNYWR